MRVVLMIRIRPVTEGRQAEVSLRADGPSLVSLRALGQPCGLGLRVRRSTGQPLEGSGISLVNPSDTAAFQGAEKQPSGPVSRVLSRAIIYLGCRLLGTSSSLPEGLWEPDKLLSHERDILLLGLAPGGVYQASRVTPTAGALLPHHFTLT